MKQQSKQLTKTIYLVQSGLNEEQDKVILKVHDGQAFQFRCINISFHNKLINIYTLDCQIQEGCKVNLILVVKKLFLIPWEYKEKIKGERFLNKSWEQQFFFNSEFHQNPEASIKNPFHELIYFILALKKLNKLEQTLELLLNQFFVASGDQVGSAENIIKQEFSSLFKVTHIMPQLVPVLSLFQIDQIFLENGLESLQLCRKEFLQRLQLVQKIDDEEEGSDKQYFRKFIVGYINIILYCMKTQEVSIEVLDGLQAQAKLSLISQMCCTIYQQNLQVVSLPTFVEKGLLCYVEASQQPDWDQSSNLAQQILQQLFQLARTYESFIGFVKVLISKISKDLIVCEINTFLDSRLKTLEDILKLLSLIKVELSRKSLEIKKIFEFSNLKQRISSTIESLEPLPIDKNLELLEQVVIFQQKNLQGIVEQQQMYQLLDKFVMGSVEQFVAMYQLVFWVQEDWKNALVYGARCIQKIEQFHLSFDEQFQAVDEAMEYLEAMSSKKVKKEQENEKRFIIDMSKLCVEKIFYKSILPDKSAPWIKFEIFEQINSCKSSTFKTEIWRILPTLIKSLIYRNDFSTLQLLQMISERINMDGQQNQFMVALFQEVIQINDAQISQEDIQMLFLENPAHYYLNLVYLNYGKFASENSGVAQILKLAEKLMDYGFTFQDLKILENDYTLKKSRLVEITEIALAKQNKQKPKPEIEKIIEDQLHQINHIEQKVDQLQTFLIQFALSEQLSMEKKEVLSIYQDYEKKQLSELTRSLGQIQNLIDISSRMYSFRKSQIFFALFKETQSESAQTLESLRDGCLAALDQFQDLVQMLTTNDEQNIRMSQITFLAQQIALSEKQVKHEMDAFRLLCKNEKQLDRCATLQELFNFELNKSNLESFCEGLTNLLNVEVADGRNSKKSLKFATLKLPTELEAAKTFLTGFRNQQQKAISISIKEFKILIRNAKGLITTLNQYVMKLIPNEQLSQQVSQQIISLLESFRSRHLPILKYIKQIQLFELEHLREYVNDFDDVGVSTQVILDYLAVWEFLDDLGHQQIDKYFGFVGYLCKMVQQAKFRDLGQKVEIAHIHLSSVEDLRSNLGNREQAKKNQILLIMSQSMICFVKERFQDLNWCVQIQYTKRARRGGSINKSTLIKYEELLELRDRALLIQNTSQEVKPDAQAYQVISSFIEFSSLITSCLNNMKNLEQYGFPQQQILRITPNFQCSECDYESLKSHSKLLAEISQSWQNSIEELYMKHYYLTFCYGQNLWILEEYLSTGTLGEKSNSIAQYVLQYMGKASAQINSQNQALDFFRAGNQITIENCQTAYRWRLSLLAGQFQSLKSQQRTTTLQNNQYQSPTIRYQKDQILYLETFDYLQGLLSGYLRTDSRFPRVDQLLFCHQDTTWTYLQFFIYRAISSPEKELYCLINADALVLEIQDLLIGLIQKLLKDHLRGTQIFSLFFIVRDNKSRISMFIRQIENKKIIRNSEQHCFSIQELSDIISQVDKTTQVYASKIAGLGKSFQIQQATVQKRRRAFWFPIAGRLDVEQLGERLLMISITDTTNLVIQLNPVDNVDLLNEILIKACLFRAFVSPQHIIVFPDNLQIYLEIQNTFDGAFESDLIYPRLIDKSRFNYITHFSVESCAIENTLSSPIQQICNFITNPNTPSRVINSQECTQILRAKFIRSQQQLCQEPNYIQLDIFKKVFSTLIRNFENSCFTYDIIVSNFGQEYSQIRNFFASAFEITVQDFTMKSINRGVKQSQAQTKQDIFQQVPQLVDEKIANNFNVNLSWESTNHFNVIVISDGACLFIYRDPIQVPFLMKKLILLQRYKRGQGVYDGQHPEENLQIDDLNTFSSVQLTENLKLMRTCSGNAMIQNESYVVTTDNYLKMCVIYLRVQSRVPVIIMGETGCGKTSLIRFLCLVVLGDKLEIFNIHAGVTAQQIIIKFEDLYQSAAELAKNNRKLWVFFDEFNTTEDLGVICEILTNRTILGRQIPNNLVLLAACNPYKLKKKNKDFDDGFGLSKQLLDLRSTSAQNLLYTVHPLPDNIIEYVWDFGGLTATDYSKYVNFMLTKNKISNVVMLTQMIVAAHMYFKEKEEDSSVSLRDVQRFIILQQWFKQSISKRLEIENLIQDSVGNFKQSIKYQNAQRFKLQDYFQRGKLYELDMMPSMLALIHCYYLRLATEKDRGELLQAVCSSQRERRDLNPQKLLSYAEAEQNDYILRMELDPSIALNQALKENIFAILPCILNRVPIFICGKPGCSKSLSISLIFSNLKGGKSQDPYFKTLENLVMVSFQGSASCTSDGVLKVYERSRNYLKSENKNLLPVFVFDEIGLAELSKHNPLKVLHSLLECENRDIAFIGISNWRLDASKMNRALYLVRPDPPLKDLISTAMQIYTQICQNSLYSSLISRLACAYFELRQQLKKQHPIYTEFYGLRDFYHLIRYASRQLLAGQEPIETVKAAIDRNFGGTFGANLIMSQIFSQREGCAAQYRAAKSHSLQELIRQNLSEKDSRYLMLIGRSDVLSYLLEDQLSDIRHGARQLVGSRLTQDANSEEYGFRSLSDIILYIEQGQKLILNEMDHIESSLYDLFNQKFTIYGDKKYCRIALGAQLNPQCFVHERFRCVVFLDDNEGSIQKKDAPLLNRFEKHHVTLETMLSHDQQITYQQCKDWIQKILKQKNQSIKINFNYLFPSLSSQSIGLIVIQVCDQLKKEDFSLVKELILHTCKEKILSFATPDLLLAVSGSDGIKKDEAQFIFDKYYALHNNYSFEQQILSCKKETDNFSIKKHLIFTFTPRILLGQLLQRQGIIFRSIQNFKSQQELTKLIQRFLSEDFDHFIIDLEYPNELNQLQLIKYLVEKSSLDFSNQKQKLSRPKSFIVLVLISRNNIQNQEGSIPIFHGWHQRMCYDLIQPKFLLQQDSFKSENLDQFLLNDLVEFSRVCSKLVEYCFFKFKLKSNQNKQSLDIENLIFRLQLEFLQDQALIVSIRDFVSRSLLTQKGMAQNWKELVFAPLVVKESQCLMDSIMLAAQTIIEKAFTNLLCVLLQASTLHTYIPNEKIANKNLIKQIWRGYLTNLKISNLQLLAVTSSNFITVDFAIRFPHITIEYMKLKNIYQEVMKRAQKRENLTEDLVAMIAHFSEEMEQQTVIEKSCFEEFKKSFELKQLYFQDICYLFLKEQLITSEYIEIIFLATRKICAEDMNIQQMLFWFFRSQTEIVNICIILSITSQIQESKQIINQLKQSLSQQGQLRAKHLSQIFLTLITNTVESLLIPKVTVQDFFQTFPIIYEQLYTQLVETYFDDLQEKLRVLRFWIELFKVLPSKDQSILKTNLEFFQAAVVIAEQKIKQFGARFLVDPDFLNLIIKFVQQSNSKVNQNLLFNWVAMYFNQVIELQPSLFFKIIELLERDQNMLKIWEFQQTFLFSLFQLAGIETHALKFHSAIKANKSTKLVLPRNQYIECVDYVTNYCFFRKDTNSKYFLTCFSDYLSKQLIPYYQSEIGELCNEFCYYSSLISEQNKPKQQNYESNSTVQQLLGHAVVKIILCIYTQALIQKKMDQHLESSDNDLVIFEGELYKMLKRQTYSPLIYCVKLIKQEKKLNKIQLKQYLQTLMKKLIWMRELEACKFILNDDLQARDDSITDYTPVFLKNLSLTKQIELHLLILIKEASIQNVQNFIKIIIDHQQLIETPVILGLCFLNNFYFQHSNVQYRVQESVLRLYDDQLKLIIQQCFSPYLSTLIRSFIVNFKKENFLYMDKGFSQDEIHQKASVCYELIILFSHSKIQHPVSSIFFDRQGQISVQNITSSYLFGQDLNIKHQVIADQYNNFEKYAYRENGTYACGNPLENGETCEYVYFVLNCGNVNQVSNCPWCQAKIGGLGHNLEQRAGHRNLTKLQAKEYLRQLLENFENKKKRPGYAQIEIANDNGTENTYQILKISWYFLRQIINGALYYMCSQNLFSNQEISSIFDSQALKQIGLSAEEFLKKKLKFDLDTTWNLLRNGPRGDQGVAIYSILLKYQQLLSDNKFPYKKFDRQENTKQFIQLIDKELFQQQMQQIAYLQQEYLQQIQELNDLSKFNSLITEVRYDESLYPKLYLYRLTSEPSSEDFANRFSNSFNRNDSFPLLKVYLDYQQDIHKLQQLNPILKFTNFLIKKFNHLIKRQDARELQIKQVFNQEDGQEIERMFRSFQHAWKNLHFEPMIQYGCKQVQYRREYKDTDELINFLPDAKEQGNGMCMLAAMQELASLQNKLLSLFINAYRQQKKADSIRYDEKFYPIQQALSTHIITFEFDLAKFANSNLQYGQGQQLFYGFARMELQIIESLFKKKFFNTDQFDFIQYQLELFHLNAANDGNQISTIRRTIPQKFLNKEEKLIVQKYFETILSIENQQIKIRELQQTMGFLVKILCYLQYAQAIGSMSIQDYVNNNPNQSLCDFFKSKGQALGRLRLEIIVALFEEAEIQYFPYIEDQISPSCKKERPQDLKEKIKSMLSYCELKKNGGKALKMDQLLPPRNDIQLAFLRFLIRCATGDIHPNEPLSFYINEDKDDLWSEEILLKDGMFRNLKERMPGDLTLEHLFQTYLIVDELNQDFNHRTAFPSFHQDGSKGYSFQLKDIGQQQWTKIIHENEKFKQKKYLQSKKY